MPEATTRNGAVLLADPQSLEADLKTELENARRRLLDLTARNRLLNIPLDSARPSNKYLRFIDAVPEIVFQQLVRDGQELAIQPIPMPDLASDETLLLETFSNDSDELVEVEEGEAASRSINSPGQINAEEHARRLGIPVSFDLPELVLSNDQKLFDEHYRRDFVRALPYQNNLNAMLKNLATTNKTSLEEMGISNLYAVFGFLEWNEPKSQPKNSKSPINEASELILGIASKPRKPASSYFAPLLLVPTGIKRGSLDSRGRATPFSIEYSGEEIEINLTLRERLRHDPFNIQLPDLGDDEESPESYFAKVSALIEKREGWRVRRQIVLANLAFHKLRIWQDLDPSIWGAGELLGHPIVRKLFIGAQPEGIFSSHDYRLDDPEIERALPPLIYDADSSQHSALIDALQGKNLVIEGPPGTGKSQTITNLIAAAMFAGKSVLFVAEKTTALGIVQKKLAAAGLGDFCLSLGVKSDGNSDGIRILLNTKDVAANLKQRLHNRGQYASPAMLAVKRQGLRESKQQLIEYVETINCRFGGCGRTIQQIIGARERLVAELGPELRLIDGVVLPAAEDLTFLQVEKMTQAAEVYVRSLLRLLDAGGFRAHPWHGLFRQPQDLSEEQGVLDGVRALLTPVIAIEQQIERIRHEGPLDLRIEGLSLPELLALESALPAVRTVERTDLLSPLSDPRRRQLMVVFGECLEEHRELRARLIREFGRVPELDSRELNLLRKSCADAAQLDAASMTIRELRKYIKWIESFTQFLERARLLSEEISRHLGFPLTCEANSFASLGKAMPLLEEAPWGAAMRHRHPIFEQEGIGASIMRAGAEADRLRALADEISKKIDWNLAPAHELLSQYAVVCANAGIFSFIDKDFRRARKDWRGMSTLRRKASPELMAEDYRSLIQYFKELKDFSSNPEWNALLGPLFNGLRTPFVEFAQLANWYESVRTRLGLGSEVALKLAQALLGAPAGNLQALLELKKEQASEFEQIHKVFGNFPGIIARLPLPIQEESRGDLKRFAARLKNFAEQLKAISAIFSEFNIDADIPFSSLPDHLDTVDRFNALQDRIQADQEVAAMLGGESLDPEMDFTEIEEALDFIEDLELSPLPASIRQWLLTDEIDSRLGLLRDSFRRFTDDLAEFQRARAAFLPLCEGDAGAWFLADLFRPGIDLRRMQAKLRTALASTSEMTAWFAYQRAKQALSDWGFADVIAMAEDGGIAATAIPSAVMYVYQNSLLRRAFETFPQLIRFDGLAHEEARKRFAAIDREVIALTREEIAWRIDQRDIPVGNGVGRAQTYTDLGLIQHLVETPKMPLKIRQLMARAGNAFLALKPCFMMSPLSVAQYLPPGAVKFDMVVMDEASQLKPEDALGAVLRGAQLVVVGDRMQLPPTDFFNSANTFGNEDDVGEAESILEMASRRYQPPRMLKWHYRSQHESLIAFSNREFYGNQLIVFPSSFSAGEGYGVTYIPVGDGVYEQTRNLPEAEQVVAFLLNHLASCPMESIGVVGMNLKQRELISELLEKKLPENPVAEQRYREWEQSSSEVFVKNLESVQGDERDVILVSATIGRDAAGIFHSTSLGALKMKSGHRRLNVLITRARKRVVVFSSIDPGEMKLTPTSSWGQRAFKDYLAFAKTGILEQPKDTVHEPDSEFEIMVADAIRKRGYEVVPQVGVTSYRIDLAVRHPELPGAYILGVECDGATYHSSRSARDRDRLRQAVLEGLGWNIHRIWSTDWFRNREGQVDKVVRCIEALRCEGAGPA
ncbi:MAG: DUF4011 domain-containing protein [Blastocatellia bacterium]